MWAGQILEPCFNFVVLRKGKVLIVGMVFKNGERFDVFLAYK